MSEFSSVIESAQSSGSTLPELSHSAPSEAATSGVPTAETPVQTPNTGSAGSAAAAPSTASALPSETATPTFAPDVLAAARQHLESTPEYQPLVELRNRLADGDLAESMPYLEMLSKDKLGFAKMMVEHLRSTGEWQDEAPAAHVAAPVAKAQPFQMPAPDLVNEQGQPIAYSAQALSQIIEGIRADISAQVNERVEPLNGILSEREEQSQRTQLLDKAKADVQRAEKHIPDFQELKPKITELLKADYAKPAAMREFNGNIYAAAHVARSAMKPSLEASAMAKAKADLNAKAAASTQGPSAIKPSVTDTTPPTGFMQAFERNPEGAEQAISRIFGR